MGCDIHDYAEVRKNGQWEKVGSIFPHPYYDPEKPESEPDEDGYRWNAKFHDHPIYCRNYDLFAMLANVRNGVGFAGCDTGDGFVPISSPRGLPKDVTHEVERQSDEWNGDGHSHSWLSLKELDAYNWDRKTKHRGWVTADEYKVFKDKGKPDGWCGGVSGPMIDHVSNQEMDRRIANGRTESVYTLVEWGESYRNSAKRFLDEIMPILRGLGGPEDVRIVFWFDN